MIASPANVQIDYAIPTDSSDDSGKSNSPFLDESASKTSDVCIKKRTIDILPPINITAQKTDHRYPDLDLSEQPLEQVLEKLISDDASNWVQQYTSLIQEGVTLSMPAMAETSAKIKNILQRFKTIYPLTPEETALLDHFQTALGTNTANGYPSLASEQLTLCFCTLRDFFLGKYATRGCTEWPANIDLPYGLSEAAEITSLKTVMGLNWERMTQPEESGLSQHWLPLIEPLAATELEYSYLQSFHTPTLRVLCMSELTIHHFNQTFAMDITLLGVHAECGVSRHDATLMNSGLFIRHDGFHAYRKHRRMRKNPAITAQLLYNGINVAYFRNIRASLTAEVREIFDFMLFISTHELQHLLKVQDTTLAKLFYGFGLNSVRSFTKEENTNKRNHSFIDQPISSQQQRMQSLLRNTKLVNATYAFYTAFKQELQRAANSRTAFNSEHVTKQLPPWAWKDKSIFSKVFTYLHALTL